MTTLTEFLLARIQEDHDVAYGGAPSPWQEGGTWDGTFDGAREVWARFGDLTAVCYYGGTYGHVLRFDPTRILRDCEAKRRVVELHAKIADRDQHDSSRRSHATLRALALPYADHPDFQEAWRV